MKNLNVAKTNLNLPEALLALETLACNLWWSWREEAKQLFESINPEFWQERQNPVAMIQATPPERFQALSDDAEFMARLAKVSEMLRREISKNGWLQKNHPEEKDAVIAYFCTEYGIHECLPIYSGGLGVLAGDHFKSASDLGLPFIAVGLLYRNGYFSQEIDAEGNQHAVYKTFDFSQLPVRRLLADDGRDLTVSVDLPGRRVYARAWLVEAGRSKLFLLDMDFEKNDEADRAITHRLYGGGREMRISQEIVLGIGGVRLLRALEIDPAVWHMNEGHVAFLTLERIREYMSAHNETFAKACEMIKANTVFTTHTPVPAGNEAFTLPLIDKYFRAYCSEHGVILRDFMKLGVQTGDQGEKFFSMTVLALRLSSASNSVSMLHQRVSQEMWAHLWPDVPQYENPITGITNGIHTRTWIAPEIAEVYSRFLAEDWDEHLPENSFWEKIHHIPFDEIKRAKRECKKRLFDFISRKRAGQAKRHGRSREEIQDAARKMNPDALTIGFARRFATYKRATLLFRDLDRLDKIVNHPERPVQLIFAGKAHPADQMGQALIREIWQISQRSRFKGKIVLLENYDMAMGRMLVQGVDVWLNNPRRPQEASGTSGQKVPMNGGANFSILDGWWPEAYNGKNGWKIGSPYRYEDKGAQDYEDMISLYETLEREIAPLYYEGVFGDGRSWEKLIKSSIASVTPVFNTHTMVQNYYRKLYAPAIGRGKALTRDEAAFETLLARKSTLRENWPLVHFIAVWSNIERREGKSNVDIKADLYLGDLSADQVEVELYCADEMNGSKTLPVILPLKNASSEQAVAHYSIDAEENLNGGGFKLRVSPKDDALAHRHELGLVYWKSLD